MNFLPIQNVMPSLKKLLSRRTRLILSAPPGAGKTTGVPPALMDEPWLEGQKILMLEPRRLAARAAAERIASQLGEGVGRTVGYRIRLESRVGPNTRIEIVTEGILTRLLQNDPMLAGIGLVVFDEFHERSLHADLGLALCLDAQGGLREDLRLMVMSATLDTKAVSLLLDGAPVVESEGRMFPVETRYRVDTAEKSPIRDTTTAILTALREETGSILVFLPGAGEIRRVHRQLLAAGLPSSVMLVPLYGALGRNAQVKAVAPPPPGIRKVVLATSIAETSLTIEGVRIVIDAGLMRVPRFDVRSGMSRLVTIPVSRDSADQRRGRAGRTEPGVCYRLWARNRHDALPERSLPDILAVDLATLALELAAWGVVNPDMLSWIDPPPPAAFAQARNLLLDLGAVNPEGRITDHGKKMAAFGLHPRLSHMLLRAQELGMGAVACEIAAILGERDFFIKGPEGGGSDIRIRLEILHGFLGKSDPNLFGMKVDKGLCRTVAKIAAALKQRLKCGKAPGRVDDAGIVLSFAYPDRIAVRRPGKEPRYLLSNGRGAYFAALEAISDEEYLAVADLDGDRQESRIFLAAPVSFEDLLNYYEEKIVEEELVEWNRRNQAVTACRQVLLGKAVLKTLPLKQPASDRVARAMCEGIRQMGIETLPWTKQLRAWQARVLLIQKSYAEGAPWPDVTEGKLLETLEKWLLPYLQGISRRDQLPRLDLKSALFSLITWNQQAALDRLAPTHVTVPSGSRIPVTYTAGEAPVLAVRLQEMFGALDTPAIAGEKIPLLLHLLSPAGRPVQITRNLKSFWKTAYFEVKKDLMGRYPKHHWPHNPLEAAPTNRAKKGSRRR